MSCEGKYYPALLEPQAQLTTHELYWNVLGLPQLPERLFDNPEMALYSVAKFADFFNRNCLKDFLSGYLKKGQEMPAGNLFLQSVSRISRSGYIAHIAGKELDRRVYLDGNYGFILCWLPEQRTVPLPLAVTSFLPGYRLNWYNRSLSYPDVTAPVIIQLQPPGHYPDGYQEALSRFHWEHALVAIDTQWAQSAGFPVVHLLPGAQNPWVFGLEKLIKRMTMRYDVTAKRCGFKPDENGLYTLPTDLIIAPS